MRAQQQAVAPHGSGEVLFLKLFVFILINFIGLLASVRPLTEPAHEVLQLSLPPDFHISASTVHISQTDSE